MDPPPQFLEFMGEKLNFDVLLYEELFIQLLTLTSREYPKIFPDINIEKLGIRD